MQHNSNVVLALVVLANVLWYTVKLVLRKHGYEVHWFYGHLRDLPNMVRLIRTVSSGQRRTTYTLLLASLVLVTAAFIVAAVRLLTSYAAA